MILRQFSSNQPYLLFVLPFTNLLIFLPCLFGYVIPEVPQQFPFDIINLECVLTPWLGAASAWIIITLGGILFNWVYNRHELHNGPTYVPALIFSNLFTVIFLLNHSITFLLAQIFMTVGANRLLEVYRQKTALDPYFRAGFWFGLAALCFPLYLTLLPMLLVAVIFTRGFNFREYIMPLAGFAFPFSYCFAAQYLLMDNWNFYLFKRIISLNTQDNWMIHSYSKLSFYALCALSLLFSMQSLVSSGDLNTNKNRNSKWMIVFMCIAMLGSVTAGWLFLNHLIIEGVGLGLIFCLSYWYSNYRVSLFAPVFFYISVLISLWILIEQTQLIPVFQW